MWTAEHRRAAERKGLRYPSDLTDAEWALVAPMIPPAKHGGRKRSVDVREVLNGTSTGTGATASTTIGTSGSEAIQLTSPVRVRRGPPCDGGGEGRIAGIRRLQWSPEGGSLGAEG